MADVRLFRLTTGEDIIGNIKEGDEESNTITLEKALRNCCATKSDSGAVTPRISFICYCMAKCDEVIFKNENILTSVHPIDELKKTYQQNTGGIVEVEKQLIT